MITRQIPTKACNVRVNDRIKWDKDAASAHNSFKNNLLTLPFVFLKILGFSPKTRQDRCGCVHTACMIVILTVSQMMLLYIVTRMYVSDWHLQVFVVS